LPAASWAMAHPGGSSATARQGVVIQSQSDHSLRPQQPATQCRARTVQAHMGPFHCTAAGTAMLGSAASAQHILLAILHLQVWKAADASAAWILRLPRGSCCPLYACSAPSPAGCMTMEAEMAACCITCSQSRPCCAACCCGEGVWARGGGGGGTGRAQV
jgi:hypothetical protein